MDIGRYWMLQSGRNAEMRENMPECQKNVQPSFLTPTLHEKQRTLNPTGLLIQCLSMVNLGTLSSKLHLMLAMFIRMKLL
jgi:hypothetical protein